MFNEIVQIVLAMGEHIDLETIGMIDRAYGWVIVDWLHFGQRIWCSCRWLTWKCPQKSRFQRKHPHKSSYIALIIFGGMLPSLQVVRVACMKLWAIRNILWSLHFHCNLDDLGAGKHRRLHLCKAQKKDRQAAPDAQDQSVFDCFGSSSELRRFCINLFRWYLHWTYIIFQYDTQCTMIRTFMSPSKTKLREGFFQKTFQRHLEVFWANFKLEFAVSVFTRMAV